MYNSFLIWFFSAIFVLIALLILIPLTLFGKGTSDTSNFFTIAWMINLGVMGILGISPIAFRRDFLPIIPQILRSIAQGIDTLVLPTDAKFVFNHPVEFEERRNYEFKEVTSANPIDAIKNTADEYAVAFLNSEGGRIFWGIQNEDRIVSGVKLEYKERDRLRRLVTEQLNRIQPALDPTRYRIELHPVYDEVDTAISDLYVVVVVIPEVKSWKPYYTGSGETFAMVDGVKKQLIGPALTDWILRRDKQRRLRDGKS